MDNRSGSQLHGLRWISLLVQVDWEWIGDAPLSTDDGSIRIPFLQNAGSFDLPIRREVGRREAFKHEFGLVFITMRFDLDGV
jgi:hypothetical protein